jgi:hypothetical protein
LIFREVEDRDLIAKARRGNVDAYNVLVSRWERRVFNYLLRLVVTDEFGELFNARELMPADNREFFRSQGYVVVLGAFGALASYALFHLVTVFPLSWILLYSRQSISQFLVVEIIGAFVGAGGIVASGLLADVIGRMVTITPPSGPRAGEAGAAALTTSVPAGAHADALSTITAANLAIRGILVTARDRIPREIPLASSIMLPSTLI